MKSLPILLLAVLLYATNNVEAIECYGCQFKEGSTLPEFRDRKCESETEGMTKHNCEVKLLDMVASNPGTTKDDWVTFCSKYVAKLDGKLITVRKRCRFILKATQSCYADGGLLKMNECLTIKPEERASYDEKSESCNSGITTPGSNATQGQGGNDDEAKSGFEVCACTGNLCNGSKSFHSGTFISFWATLITFLVRSG